MKTVSDGSDNDANSYDSHDDAPVKTGQAVAEANDKDSKKNMFYDMSKASNPGSEAIERAIISEDLIHDISRARTIKEKDMEITSADKHEFINALVSNRRMKLSFSFFGDKMTCTIRSRTQRESEAIYSVIRKTLSESESPVYSTINSNAPFYFMACQVSDINGVSYPEFSEPMSYVASEDGLKEPSWLKAADAYKLMSPVKIDSLGYAISVFEYKYLTMLNEARNENFWKTDSSTEQ